MRLPIPSSAAARASQGSDRARGGVLRTTLLQIALVLLAIVYGYAAGSGVRSAADSGALDVAAGTHGYSVVGPSGLLLHHAPTSENVVHTSGGGAVSGIKDRLTLAVAAVRSSERAVGVVSAHHVQLARSALLALRRCTLLFPFHFFW